MNGFKTANYAKTTWWQFFSKMSTILLATLFIHSVDVCYPLWLNVFNFRPLAMPKQSIVWVWLLYELWFKLRCYVRHPPESPLKSGVNMRTDTENQHPCGVKASANCCMLFAWWETLWLRRPECPCRADSSMPCMVRALSSKHLIIQTEASESLIGTDF